MELIHNTDKKNVNGIKAFGLKGSFADDPNNLTNKVFDANNRAKGDLKGKVYLGKTDSVADGIAAMRDTDSTNLKVNIPEAQA